MAVHTPSPVEIDPAADPVLVARPIPRSSLDGPPGSWIDSAALFFTGNPMNGTVGDDFMFGLFDGPNHTINADSGDDFVIGDMDNFTSSSGATNNNSIATALSLENPNIWTIDENALFGNSSIPHSTSYVEATAGQSEFYAVTIGAGQTITVDIDYGGGAIGGPTNTVAQIFDSFSELVASTNDSPTTDGGFGSTSGLDPFLSFTAGVGGTYYISVYESSDGVNLTFEGGETFLMNVSVTGHTFGSLTAQGSDTIDGGSGADELFGNGGNDSIIGGSSADLLHGGSGNDTLLGGFVVDTVFGGDGNDLIRILDGEFIDNVDGGLGTDTLDLSDIEGDGFEDVDIDLGAGTFNGYGGITTITSVESVIGGQGDDTLDAGDISGVTLNGGSGDDFIDGGLNFQALLGGLGNDTIFADVSFSSGVGDSIDGDSGNDSLVGAFGEDTISGGSNNDLIDGGDGDDLLDGGFDSDTVLGGLGNDTIFASQLGPTSFGDLIDGGAGDDSLIGGAGDDVISDGDGEDTIAAGDGNDTVIGGFGLDVSDGGIGIDTMDVSAFGGAYVWNMTTGVTNFAAETAINFENAVTGAGDDSITGTSGANSIVTNGGNDTVIGSGGNDTVDGGIGNDDLAGGGGLDLLTGGDGADTLAGGGEGDTLLGGIGKDLLDGGNGVDSLVGGDANDTLAGGGDGDMLDGGAGSDWADYSGSAAKVTADLKTPANNTGEALGDSYVSIENLRGATDKDKLSGNDQANRLEGLDQNDTLTGKDGDDTLAGGLGKDNLKGNDGADRFEFASESAADADRIVDFLGGTDEIALDSDVFGLAEGALPAGRFVVGAAAGDANDRLIYNDANGKLFFDADGTGAQAQVLIATMTGAPTIDAADFIVI